MVEKDISSIKHQSTKMNTIVSLLFASLCLAGAFASPTERDKPASEVRTIYNSGGGIYLGLNSTIVWIGVLLLAALALAALLGVGLFGETGTSGYNQQRYDNYYGNEGYGYQQQQDYRTKRSFDESKSIKSCNVICSAERLSRFKTQGHFAVGSATYSIFLQTEELQMLAVFVKILIHL